MKVSLGVKGLIVLSVVTSLGPDWADSTSLPAATAQPGPTLGQEAKLEKVRALLIRARKLVSEDNLNDAKPLLEQAAQLDPNANSASVHQNLGVVYQKLGDASKALKEYEQALKLRPGMAASLLNIAQCHLALGNQREAIGYMERYIAEDGGSPNVPAVQQMIASLKESSHNQGAAVSNDYLESATKEGTYRWRAEDIPLKVFIEDGRNVKGYRPVFHNLLVDSLNQWSEASQGRIYWKIVSDRNSANIICSWTDDVQYSGQGVEAGETDTTAQANADGSKTLLGARVSMLTRWKGKALSDADIKTACLHELGHALGLKEHSLRSGDIMFFSDFAALSPVLSARDKATIARLYESYPVRTSRVEGAGRPPRG